VENLSSRDRPSFGHKVILEETNRIFNAYWHIAKYWVDIFDHLCLEIINQIHHFVRIPSSVTSYFTTYTLACWRDTASLTWIAGTSGCTCCSAL